MMDLPGALSSIMLSGFIYDGIMGGASLTKEFLKSKLRDWIIDDQTIDKIHKHLIQDCELNEDMNPKAIQRRIDSCEPLLKLLSEIKPSETTTSIVNQTSTVGNNVVNSGGSVSIGSTVFGKDM